MIRNQTFWWTCSYLEWFVGLVKSLNSYSRRSSRQSGLVFFHHVVFVHVGHHQLFADGLITPRRLHPDLPGGLEVVAFMRRPGLFTQVGVVPHKNQEPSF